MKSLGGYEVLAELKRGGMGEVLLARRRGVHGFERLVAIKTVRGELRDRPELRTMFLDEARLMARLHHPAIAQVYDFAEEEGLLYLVLEYVAGVSFAHLATLRPPPSVCAQALAEALHGLHAAHELLDERGEALGVVHRDISPQNLLLTFEGRVKVLDFGIALVRGREAPETELGTIKGKPAYMAPEQLAGEPVDRRTDVYASGVVLHELCTGERLFASDSPFVVARRIEHGDIPRPSTLCELPAGLDELVMRALAREPSARFPTAAAMAEALDRLVAEMDGERLAAFAERRLGRELAEHRALLRKLTAQEPVAPAPEAPEGRATGVVTLPDAAVPTAPTRVAPPEPRRRRMGTVLLVLAAIAAIVAVTVRFARTPTIAEEAQTPMPTAVTPPVEATIAPSAVTTAAPIMTVLPSAAPERARPLPPARSTVSPAPAPSLSATAPPPPPATVAAQGFLTIGAEPYALVQLDGVALGPTPIIRRAVSAGPHTVVLTTPDTGQVRLSQTITVEPGKTANVGVR